MELLFESTNSKLFGITIFLSVVGFQVVYILLQWIYIRRSDYLYYIAYMLSAVVYILGEFEPILPFRFLTNISPGFYNYVRHSLPLLSLFLYYRFARAFLSLPRTRPMLNKWVMRLEYFMLFYSLLAPVLVLCGFSLKAELYAFITASIITGSASFFIIISFLQQSNVLTRFAMWGAGFLLAGCMLTLYFRYQIETGSHLHFDPYVPMLVCSIAELLTFTTGLSYKTRLIEAEKAEQEKTLLREIQEKQQLQIELLNVRSHIARDLHDEIGSGLSKISLLGEVIKKQSTIGDNKIDKIISSSKEMVQSMRDLIWSLNTDNDKLDNLISYIRRYASEYFEHTGIELSMEVPDQVPPSEIPSRQRRVLLMVIKEAFNNILKHSQASKIRICIELNGEFSISIEDNGVGMQNAGKGYGQGLKNMRSRLGEIDGSFELISHSGTKLTFRIPLLQYEG